MPRLPLDNPVLDCPWKKAATPPPAPPAPAAPSPTPPPAPTEKPRRKGKAAAAATAVAPPEPAPEAPVEIVNSGSHVPIPLPFKPVSPMELLAAANPDALKVMLRQLRDMQGVQPDTSNGVLRVIGRLSEGFKTGKDVSAQMSDVAIHLTGRPDRRELLAELMDALDDERLVEICRSRSKFEDFLHACQRRSDVSITEGIAMQTYFNHELDKIFTRREKRSSGSDVSGREPRDLLSRANLPSNLHHKEIQDQFEDVPPTEREILRKLAFKMQQNVAVARLTRTTTETVELVDGGPPGNPAAKP